MKLEICNLIFSLKLFQIALGNTLDVYTQGRSKETRGHSLESSR